MRLFEFESTKKSHKEYVIFVDGKPATKYETREEAQRDIDSVKDKYPDKKFEIKLRDATVNYHSINEDVSSTPGGVGASTKMVMEKDHEARPRVRSYKNKNDEKRWEVLDWEGVRHGPAFHSRENAREYLERHRNELEYPEDLNESNPKWQKHYTPRQKAGLDNWHEIDRAYRQVNVKNPSDPLRQATVKFFGSDDKKILSREETESLWQFIKDFNRDPKNQPNQPQLYDALSTEKGIEQVLQIMKTRITENEQPSTVWMIEWVSNADKRKPAFQRITHRLYYRNEEDALVAVTKLRNKLADVYGAGAIEISSRGVPKELIR